MISTSTTFSILITAQLACTRWDRPIRCCDVRFIWCVFHLMYVFFTTEDFWKCSPTPPEEACFTVLPDDVFCVLILLLLYWRRVIGHFLCRFEPQWSHPVSLIADSLTPTSHAPAPAECSLSHQLKRGMGKILRYGIHLHCLSKQSLLKWINRWHANCVDVLKKIHAYNGKGD